MQQWKEYQKCDIVYLMHIPKTHGVIMREDVFAYAEVLINPFKQQEKNK